MYTMYTKHLWYKFKDVASKVIPEVSMQIYFKDMPYEILFEIFRQLPKDKLIEISRLSPKFRDIAGDTRLWKNVYIGYESRNGPFAFEELYSESWPVREIDLTETQINPPVASKTDQVVKVIKLDLASIVASEVTVTAILTKYQCTELVLDGCRIDLQGRIMGISPKIFSKQTALEVLSLRGLAGEHFDSEYTSSDSETSLPRLWPVRILSNCKHLKSLDLSDNYLTNLDLMRFVKHLPTSLEKLRLQNTFPEDSFFKLLVKITPNLKELGLDPTSVTAECPSLLKFKFLETLEISPYHDQDISHFCLYIKMFPALKRVNILFHNGLIEDPQKTQSEELREMLESHRIIVGQTDLEIDFTNEILYSGDDNNVWVIESTGK